jgi:hypothetical protein
MQHAVKVASVIVAVVVVDAAVTGS